MGNNSLLLLLAPELVLTAGGLAILLAGLIWRRKESYRPLVSVAAAVGLVALGVSLLSTVGAGLPQGMFVGDRLTSYIRVLAAATTVLSLVLALSRPQLGNEFPALLLFATLGITLAAGASNLVMLYVAIELLSITCYVLAGLFRDEARSRGGLIRVREFLMKDAYSCHADQASLDEFYPRIYDAYVRIFRRCHVDHIAVEADTGMMGGPLSHEFMVLTEVGEDTLIRCQGCAYSANVERAEFAKGEATHEAPRPLEAVPTPEAPTIEAVAAYLGVPTSQTLKAVFYTTAEGEVIFAVIRGDLSINEVKLSNLLGGTTLRPASEEELREKGIVAGYASPIGVRGVRVVVDDSARSGTNFVAGANRPGYHYLNVNYPRDFQADIEADIALARGGSPCPRCAGMLQEARGIEIGHLFKLGTRYSSAVGATFLDPGGQARPIVMGSYGIGAGRLLAAIVEQHHDDKGIIWPPSVAPFQVHLVSLGLDRPEAREGAEALYAELEQAGLEVLYDDRAESAGVKFNDADLIGVPLRLTISPRTLKAETVEAKLRRESEATLLPRGEAVERARELLARA